MQDIAGNNIEVGTYVYIVAEAVLGSKSKRLLFGKVKSLSESGNKAVINVLENGRDYTKTSATIVRPME